MLSKLPIKCLSGCQLLQYTCQGTQNQHLPTMWLSRMADNRPTFFNVTPSLSARFSRAAAVLSKSYCICFNRLCEYLENELVRAKHPIVYSSGTPDHKESLLPCFLFVCLFGLVWFFQYILKEERRRRSSSSSSSSSKTHKAVPSVDGLQSIPVDSNHKDVAAMLDELTIEANEESFVIVLRHGGNDITCILSIEGFHCALKKERSQLHLKV